MAAPTAHPRAGTAAAAAFRTVGLTKDTEGLDALLLTVLAFAWKTYLLGFVSALLLVAAVLGALGQIGAALRWIKERFWPSPPSRIKFRSAGATMSREVDANNRFAGWDFVCPDMAVRNDGPSALYELEAGAIDPRGTGERVVHPGRVQRLSGEGTEHAFGIFGSGDRLLFPPEWLARYDGQEPHQQVVYFIAATDERGRRWEATCRADADDDWVPLTFSRA